MKMFTVKLRLFCFVMHLVSLLLGSSPVWTASVAVGSDEASKSIDLLMPNVQPQIADSYFCHSLKVNSEIYITGFQPKADMNIAHHILIYGCSIPGSKEKVWDCGEMHKQQLEQAPVCEEGSNIIYAWAMDAPALHLPAGVGFKVGGDSEVGWLVLQVHYKSVDSFLPPKNGHDNSGVTLVTTAETQPRRAGVYLLGTLGQIPPHSTTYMETACSFNEPIVMHPFAFRTHAHTHGKVVSGYRVRKGEWKEIGRKNPQLPQMFYNITHPGMTVESGDMLAARCTMVNNDSATVYIGATSQDEMCNFYIMYYVDGGELAKETSCFTGGPPVWNWSLLSDLHPENAPLNASIIPGTKDLLESTQKFFKDVEKTIDRQRQMMKSKLDGILGAFRGFRGSQFAEKDFPDEKELFNDEMQSDDDDDGNEKETPFFRSLFDSDGVEDDRY